MKEHYLNKLFAELKMNPKEFSESLGLPRPDRIYNVLNGKNGVSSNLAKIIHKKYTHVNYNWLLTGKGDLLIEDNKILAHSNDSNGVPFYDDINSTGGILTSYSDVKEVPTFFINYEHFNDCTAYITHVGDSMYPKYCAGEIIAIKKIDNLDVMQWGEAYLVVTNENANSMRTVKLVFSVEGDNSKLCLRASNPNFKGDTIINKNDIVSLFIVKGKITRNQL